MANKTPNTTQITFDKPVTIDGKETNTLTMREPKVKDMRAAKRGNEEDADMETQLFANLCDISREDVDEMTISAYGKLQEAYRGFID